MTTAPAPSIISITPSRRNLPSSKSNEFHVAVKLSAPKLALTQRRSVSVAVALDVSGSMADYTSARLPNRGARLPNRGAGMSKLDLAKHALEKLVEHLSEHDCFSLTVFHDTAHVAFASQKMGTNAKRSALSVIQSIHTQGCTNLAEGLYSALRQLDSATPGVQGVTQRAMLFTDGEANRGDVTLDQIERGLKTRFHALRAGISTFGVGSSYNGELLGVLARNGGAHYYIDDAERIPTAFGTELGTLTSLYAEKVELTLRPAEGVQILEVVNDLKHSKVVDSSLEVVCIDCDDLYSEQNYNVLFSVRVPKRRAIKDFSILTVEGLLKDVTTGGTLMFAERLSITLCAVKNADKTDNPEVASALALQLAARSQKEAMEAAARNDFATAQRVLRTAGDIMTSLGRSDLSSVNYELSEKGFIGRGHYNSIGSKLSSSLRNTYSTQRAGMGGTKVAGVDVDSMLSNSTQRQMANAFSITKSASPDDEMPDIDSMVTSK